MWRVVQRLNGDCMSDLNEIVDIFDLLGDWDQRYQYMIELGEKLPPIDDAERCEDNLVKGCMSQVWITARCEDGVIHFDGDSDTAVIKGILALLIDLSDGHSAEQISKIDMDEIFARLNLDEHLSPNRHVGVYAMFDLMKQKARAADKAACAA